MKLSITCVVLAACVGLLQAATLSASKNQLAAVLEGVRQELNELHQREEKPGVRSSGNLEETLKSILEERREAEKKPEERGSGYLEESLRSILEELREAEKKPEERGSGYLEEKLREAKERSVERDLEETLRSILEKRQDLDRETRGFWDKIKNHFSCRNTGEECGIKKVSKCCDDLKCSGRWSGVCELP